MTEFVFRCQDKCEKFNLYRIIIIFSLESEIQDSQPLKPLALY